MSIGLVDGITRRSKYGLGATFGDVDTGIIAAGDGLIEFAMALRRSENELSKSSDPNAASMGESLGVSSAAAMRAARRVFNALKLLKQRALDHGPYYGFVTVTFVGGTKGETKTVTVTGQPWVIAGTSKVVPINNTPAVTSAVEYYSPSVSNYVTGAGFDVSLTTTDAATPLGQVGSVFWIGLPNG